MFSELQTVPKGSIYLAPFRAKSRKWSTPRRFGQGAMPDEHGLVHDGPGLHAWGARSLHGYYNPTCFCETSKLTRKERHMERYCSSHTFPRLDKHRANTMIFGSRNHCSHRAVESETAILLCWQSVTSCRFKFSISYSYFNTMKSH